MGLPDDFTERGHLAYLVATATDAEILDLCELLGEDPQRVAEDTRKLLLDAVMGNKAPD